MNNLSFSFTLLAALFLWIIPFLVSLLVTLKYPLLRGISGGIAQIVGIYLLLVIEVEFLLGIFGLLSFWYVFFVHIVLLSLTIIFITTKETKFPFSMDNWVQQNFERVRINLGEFRGYQWFLLSVLISILMISMFNLLSSPNNIDCLYYVLPQVVEWFQSQNIFAHNVPLAFYHQNSSLIVLWCLIPFSTDIFINLQNIPAAILTFVAIVNLLRFFKVDRKLSFLAGVTFLSLPQVFSWIWNQKPELLLTGFFTLSLCFFFEYLRANNKLNLMISFFCVGLVAGTKTFGLLYGVLLYFVFVGFCIYKKTNRKWLWLFIGSFFCLVLTMQWPLRNLIIWGNPLYPIEITISKNIKFVNVGFVPGAELNNISRASLAARLSLNNIFIFFKGILARYGLVSLLALFITPLSFFIPFFIKTKKYIFLLALLIVGSFTCYISIPWRSGTLENVDLTHTAYFGMPFFAISLVMLIIVCYHLKFQSGYILEFLLVSQITYGIVRYFLKNIDPSMILILLIAQIVAVLIVFIFLFVSYCYKKSTKYLYVFISLGVLFWAVFGGILFGPIHRYRMRQRCQNDEFLRTTNISCDILKWIDQNISSKTIIICPLKNGYDILPYPLYGGKFNNKVIRGPLFSRAYRPDSSIDIVIVSGNKREGKEEDSIRLPLWIMDWGNNFGFELVYSDGIQCIFGRKAKNSL